VINIIKQAKEEQRKFLESEKKLNEDYKKKLRRRKRI
jgi:hypothetical protein